MAGWVHRHVIMDQEVIQATPTPKTLFLVEVQSHTSMSGVLTNTSLTQDMAVEVSESWDGVTRWASLTAINSTQFAEPLAPGESRHFQVDCRDLRHVRFQATALGAGLDAVVSAQQVNSLGVR